MKITDVRVYKAKGKSAVKANCSITFDDAFVVSGITVLDGKKGLWVSMPRSSYKDAKGENIYRDIVFPISKKGREYITETVLKAYEDAANEEGGENPFK